MDRIHDLSIVLSINKKVTMEYFEIRTDLTPKLNADVKTLTVHTYVHGCRLLVERNFRITLSVTTFGTANHFSAAGFGGIQIM